MEPDDQYAVNTGVGNSVIAMIAGALFAGFGFYFAPAFWKDREHIVAIFTFMLGGQGLYWFCNGFYNLILGGNKRARQRAAAAEKGYFRKTPSGQYVPVRARRAGRLGEKRSNAGAVAGFLIGAFLGFLWVGFDGAFVGIVFGTGLGALIDSTRKRNK
ncbi:MAG: hypothetical protein AB1714_03310 [Acidobacteriota bacterium]